MQNTDEPTPTGESPRRMLGGFIRAQRQMANLSLRQLSVLTEVSNPYLSQVERGSMSRLCACSSRSVRR